MVRVSLKRRDQPKQGDPVIQINSEINILTLNLWVKGERIRDPELYAPPTENGSCIRRKPGTKRKAAWFQKEEKKRQEERRGEGRQNE